LAWELPLEQGAEFVVVGAHALAVHGAARATHIDEVPFEQV
jgi:hypothetical protein